MKSVLAALKRSEAASSLPQILVDNLQSRDELVSLRLHGEREATDRRRASSLSARICRVSNSCSKRQPSVR